MLVNSKKMVNHTIFILRVLIFYYLTSCKYTSWKFHGYKIVNLHDKNKWGSEKALRNFRMAPFQTLLNWLDINTVISTFQQKYSNYIILTPHTFREFLWNFAKHIFQKKNIVALFQQYSTITSSKHSWKIKKAWKSRIFLPNV